MAHHEESEWLKRAQLIANLGNWDQDPNTNELWWSDQTYRIFGLEPQSREMDFDSFLEMVHPDDRSLIMESTELALKSDQDPYKVEYRVLRNDGSLRHVYEEALIERDESGEPLKIVGIIQDITERKENEEKLREVQENLEIKVRERTEIRESEERFSAFANASFEGIIISEKGRFVDANKHFSNLFGYDAEELMGKEIIDLVAPEDREKVIDRNLSGYEEPYFHKALTKDGRIFEVEVCGRSLNYHGRKCRITAIRDVTERKRFEEDILRAKQDWENTFDSVQDPIMIVDTEYRMQRVNLAMAGKLGVPPQEAVGKFCYDLIRCPKEKGEGCLHRKLLESGKPKSIEIFDKGFGGHFHKSAFPIKDYSSSIIGAVHIFRDINKRKTIEDALQESEERFRSIMEFSPSVIEVYDRDGVQTYVNKAYEELWGFPASHTVNKFNVLKSKEVEDTGLMEYVKKAYSGEVVSVPIYKFDSRGDTEAQGIGRVRWLSTWIYPLKDKEGIVENIVISHEDVSGIKAAEEERKELEQQLRHAVKMEAIGTLAGGIAHDFNNILGIILGYAEMAKEDAQPKSEISKQIDSVIKAGLRGKELVKHILAFSRKIEQDVSPVRLDLLVSESLKLMRASIPSTIKIQQGIDAQSPVIMADPTQIHQVLINLCTNAADTMEREGGVLNVELTCVYLIEEDVAAFQNAQPGRFAKLSVSDTGEGIESEVLERIFEPFFTTKQQEKGTGMGLAVVHGIVTSLGGIIRIESKIGQGTNFDVYFPLAVDEEEIKKLKKSPEPKKGSGHVLFVDDEEMMVEMGQAVLDRLGYRVTATINPDEALELFKANPVTFDIVITDQTMPDKTGMQLAKELLEIRSDIPIVLCTGFSKKISEEEIRKIGIKELAMKPLEISKMAEVIRRALDA